MRTRQLVLAAVFAAIIAILAPLSIPTGIDCGNTRVIFSGCGLFAFRDDRYAGVRWLDVRGWNRYWANRWLFNRDVAIPVGHWYGG